MLPQRAPEAGSRLAALAALPGGFEDGRKVFRFPPIETETARGGRRRWTLRVRVLVGGRAVPVEAAWLAGAAPPAGAVGELGVESHSLLPGGEVGAAYRGKVPTLIAAGKNLGRANATTAVTQAFLEGLALYEKKRRRAAPPPAAGAPAAPPAAPPPMLVQRVGGSRAARLDAADFARGLTAQPKLNGVRLVARRAGAGAILYSRTAKEYPGVEAARAGAARLLADPPPVPEELWRAAECAAAGAADAGGADSELAALYARPDAYIDGELYAPGRPLEYISGQARKGRDEGELRFYVFDVFFPQAKARGHDMASACRQRYLDALFAAAGDPPGLVRVENFPLRDEAELDALYARFLSEGYEGAIVRKDWAGYEYGLNNYHSANVLKKKPTLDDEFPIVGYKEGRGKNAGAVIWVCAAPGGRTFGVAPKMPLAERRQVFRCLGRTVAGTKGESLTRFERDFRGRPLVVEFAALSDKTGVPLQPRGAAVRTYESGAGGDPLRRLFDECPAEGAEGAEDAGDGGGGL